MDYARRCMEALDASPYLDYTLHGLLHGYYDGGKLVTEEQYYPKVYDAARGGYTKAWRRLSPAEFRRHLDLFFAIYRSWGLTKPVRTFAAPNGNRGTPEENAVYADILREYGILYWRDTWDEMAGDSAVVNGVICSKEYQILHWNVFDADPALLPVRERVTPDLCCHWPNFLRWNPEHNLERIPAWAAYFRRQAEVWGVMLAPDAPTADSQGVYRQFARLRTEGDTCVVDLTEVDRLGASGLKDEFFLSLRGDAAPVCVEGGTVGLYETKRDFRNWKVVRDGGKRVVLRLR